RLERLRLPHADLGRKTAVEGIGTRHGRRIGLVLFSRLVSLFLRIRLEERILRWRALKAARQQIAGLHFGDLRLRLEAIAVQRSEDRFSGRKSDHRDDADEAQRPASTGAAENAAPEPLETGMACRDQGHWDQGSERDAEIVRPSSESSTIGVTGRE